jgi:hypothetical protein
MKQRTLCTTGQSVLRCLKVSRARHGQNRYDWQETVTPEELNVRRESVELFFFAKSRT